MVVATSKRYVNLGAAATASVVALGLLAAPPERYESSTLRTESAVVQLRAVASTQIIALAAAVKTLPASASATPYEAAILDSAPPQASATGSNDALTAIATAAIALVAAPFWYLAFPVTLPLSVVGGLAFAQLANALPAGFGLGGRGDPLTLGLLGAALGLGAFVVGPLGFAFGALSSLAAAPASSLLPAASQRPISDGSASLPSEAIASVSVDPMSATDPDRPEAATKLDGVAKRNTRGAEQRSGVTAHRVDASAAPQPGVDTAEIETAPAGTAEAAATIARSRPVEWCKSCCVFA